MAMFSFYFGWTEQLPQYHLASKYQIDPGTLISKSVFNPCHYGASPGSLISF